MAFLTAWFSPVSTCIWTPTFSYSSYSSSLSFTTFMFLVYKILIIQGIRKDVNYVSRLQVFCKLERFHQSGFVLGAQRKAHWLNFGKQWEPSVLFRIVIEITHQVQGTQPTELIVFFALCTLGAEPYCSPVLISAKEYCIIFCLVFLGGIQVSIICNRRCKGFNFKASET